MLEALTAVSFLVLMAVIARTDQRTMKIPDGLILAVLAVGAVSVFTMPDTGLLSRGIGMFAVSSPLLVISMMIPNAFGGGDIKLTAAGGFFLGWRLILMAFGFSIVGGGVYGLALLLSGKRGRRDLFAFGPFLCAGMALAYFFGDALWKYL